MYTTYDFVFVDIIMQLHFLGTLSCGHSHAFFSIVYSGPPFTVLPKVLSGNSGSGIAHCESLGESIRFSTLKSKMSVANVFKMAHQRTVEVQY